MAGPNLGTLLIQRLDAALGTTLSQQTQIVNRASPDPITRPGQTIPPEPVSNTLVRDSRDNADRALLTAKDRRVDAQRGTGEHTVTRHNTSQPVTTSATTSLGLAARIILNLLANHDTGPSPIAARTPLLKTDPHQAEAIHTRTARSTLRSTESGPPQPAAATRTVSEGDPATLLARNLTRALAQSLQQSGLFYESHLKSMLGGHYRIADILKEPQAQITDKGLPSRDSSRSAEPSQSGPRPTTSSASQGQSAQSTSTTLTSTTTQNVQNALLTPGVDPATHGIVRQQLEALADQSIHWRGEAWPGALMDWHIKREPDGKPSPGPENSPEATWQSQITIQLPRLGHVTIDIRLSGTQISLTLQASESTTPLLRTHTTELYEQISDHQLELAQVVVTTLQDNDESGSTGTPDTTVPS